MFIKPIDVPEAIVESERIALVKVVGEKKKYYSNPERKTRVYCTKSWILFRTARQLGIYRAIRVRSTPGHLRKTEFIISNDIRPKYRMLPGNTITLYA